MVVTEPMTEHSPNTDSPLYGEKLLLPTCSAMGLCNGTLLLGFASTFGNYWTGGLGIYRHFEKELEPKHLEASPKMMDLTSHLDLFTPFEASIASIATLEGSGTRHNTPVAVGLDDGSIHLLRLPSKAASDEESIKLTLSANSTTYHDAVIQRLANANGSLVSLDIDGSVKIWDLESLTPTTSWSIGSTSWPLGGRALPPDISVSPQSTTESMTLATLLPCDALRQLALWDSRASSLRGPSLQWSSMVDSGSKDLPSSVAWLSSNLLLVGTFHGHVHVYDVRNLSNSENPNSICSMEVGNWLSDGLPPFPGAGGDNGSRQILQIITQSAATTIDQHSSQFVGLVGLSGSVVVLQTDSAQNNPLSYRYHNKQSACPPSHIRRGTSMFFPVDGTSNWRLLHSTGFPQCTSIPTPGQVGSLLLHSGTANKPSSKAPTSPSSVHHVRCLTSVEQQDM